MVTVELIPAYVWDCDHCGAENFQRHVSRLLRDDNPVEARQIRAVESLPAGAPLPPDLKYRVYSAPSRVSCRKCRAMFRAAALDDSFRPEPDDE